MKFPAFFGDNLLMMSGVAQALKAVSPRKLRKITKKLPCGKWSFPKKVIIFTAMLATPDILARGLVNKFIPPVKSVVHCQGRLNAGEMQEWAFPADHIDALRYPAGEQCIESLPQGLAWTDFSLIADRFLEIYNVTPPFVASPSLISNFHHCMTVPLLATAGTATSMSLFLLLLNKISRVPLNSFAVSLFAAGMAVNATEIIVTGLLGAGEGCYNGYTTDYLHLTLHSTLSDLHVHANFADIYIGLGVGGLICYFLSRITTWTSFDKLAEVWSKIKPGQG